MLVGLVLLIAWQLVPAIRIFPHVIYLEWVACILTYVVTAIVAPEKKEIPVVCTEEETV